MLVRKNALLLVALIVAAGCVSQGGRPDYNLPESVFSELPPLPADFYQVDDNFYHLRIDYRELANLKESYWKQPEFYPTWETTGLELFRNPWTNSIAVAGINSYPADQTFRVKAGDELAATVFFRSSWAVQTYQGMGMSANYDSTHFNVTVDPDSFVLGPNYTVFTNNWVQKVAASVKIKEGTPQGEYVIGVNPSRPQEDREKEWQSIYGNHYVGSPSFALDRPYFKLTLVVV